jgi:hypothetical protein
MTKNDEERSDRSQYGAGTERDRSWCVRALAIARPFLPAAAAFSIDQGIYGRYETLAEAQRDLTAELAAQTLRDQPGRHFK